MRLNPFHPARFWHHLARALCVARRYTEAADVLSRIASPDEFHLAFLGACHAMAGDTARATEQAQATLKRKPDFGVARNYLPTLHYRRPGDLDHHRDALLKASPDADPWQKFGKRIAELTPPLLARALCPSITELKALAATAARIATRKGDPSDQPIAEKLSRDQVNRITAAVQSSMSPSASGKLDVYRWSQLADVSTSRVGLLLCGDLEAARAELFRL